jgi:hypothetical protein
MDTDGPTTELVRANRPHAAGPPVPALIADAREDAARRFVEFFTAHIENPNTRLASARAVDQFLPRAEAQRLTLRTIEPIAVAAYVQELKGRLATPSVKQHLVTGVLPHLPGDRYHRLPGGRRHHREAPADSRPRVVQDDQVLRPTAPATRFRSTKFNEFSSDDS